MVDTKKHQRRSDQMRDYGRRHDGPRAGEDGALRCDKHLSPGNISDERRSRRAAWLEQRVRPVWPTVALSFDQGGEPLPVDLSCKDEAVSRICRGPLHPPSIA